MYHCQCGSPLLTITTHKRKFFNVSFHCAYCGRVHYLRVSRNALWGKEALPLVCPDVEATVGFIGPKQKVNQACQEKEKSIGELAAELGYENEFENPEVMIKVLDMLHLLAKQGNLGCRCGNRHLTFELMPDHIELYCESCEAIGIIYADNPESVLLLEGMSSLYLEENKTWVVNRPFKGHHLAKTNEEE